MVVLLEYAQTIWVGRGREEAWMKAMKQLLLEPKRRRRNDSPTVGGCGLLLPLEPKAWKGMLLQVW